MAPRGFTQTQLQGVIHLGATVATALRTSVDDPATSPIANDPVEDRISVAISAAIQAAYLLAARVGMSPADFQRHLRDAADQMTDGRGEAFALAAISQGEG